MELSIIYLSTEDNKEEKATIESIAAEAKKINGDIELLVATELKQDIRSLLPQNVTVQQVDVEEQDDNEIILAAMNKIDGEWFTVMRGGDTCEEGLLAKAKSEANAHKEYAIIMPKKFWPNKATTPFAKTMSKREVVYLNLTKRYAIHPFFMEGTFFKKSLLEHIKYRPELGMEAERDFCLRACVKEKKMIFLQMQKFHLAKFTEGEKVYYEGVYNPDWYNRSFTDYWLPYLEEFEQAGERVPTVVQYDFMFSVASRLLSNWNNRNKHVIDEEQGMETLRLIGRCFAYISDEVLYNAREVKECSVPNSLKWIYGTWKNGKDFTFDKHYLMGDMYYGASSVSLDQVCEMATNIVFMDYDGEYLEIDGSVHPILYSMADSVYFVAGTEKYKLKYNQRYSINKVFGISLYKAHSFHVSIPISSILKGHLFCFANFGEETVKIHFSYESHFSRMSGRFENSYWRFGEDKEYIMTKSEDGLLVKKDTANGWKKQERALIKEMRAQKRKREYIFIAVRKAYFMAKPFLKRKPIWMYLDKIYKAGDSSEYLYRYACAQNDDIKHYYLVDKKSADYERLKKDGYKPLVRGSIKHRLIFLLADMMVISNSTVFAFNDFRMMQSSYVRDLTDFHVCCVQHGMSVQKIAVAQNRLRDNIRLYFCASKYEIENLSRPVYNYAGMDILKLTGVPRYDGLVNRDKKQILISPTWRMQAAAPVRKSESQQRDYNPMFKESSYYKVYNALINHPRLIEAAKKYGYRIAYVLHPIVSAQLKDFEKNDMVDIIPSVGDFSYEKMFCESSLMVTDYSGVQFDFAYMRKPVVYLHHEDIPQHYEEGSFFYDTMGFGEIVRNNEQLVDLLCEYMENGCQMKPEYVARADDFFYYNDHNNCERIYQTMLEYQENHIRHTGREFSVRPNDAAIKNFDNRKHSLKEVNNLLSSYQKLVQRKRITDRYYEESLDEKAILLLGLGHNVRGNLQYILNELNSNDEFKEYRMYVRTNESTQEIVKEYIRNNHWTRTEPVLEERQYSILMESAKYLITEVFFPQGWVKKPGQVVINIWHGTPLKKLGLAKNSKNAHRNGITQKNFIEADYLLYPNEYTRDNMLRSYKVQNLMNGKALLLGYPRTGGILENMAGDMTQLKQILAPNGERIFAYMPTWKDYLKEEKVVAESKELLDYIDANLPSDCILYVNLHHKVSDFIDYDSYTRVKKFPPNVDSYALLAATQALITDYSSVFYDYLATRKHIILHCGDYELYAKKRGTYMNLMDLPFDKAATKEEVLACMLQPKNYDDEKAYQLFNAYDSKENAKKLCRLFLGDESGLNLETIEHDQRKRILLYTDRASDEEERDMMAQFAAGYHSEAQELYFSCARNRIKPFRKEIYPLFFEHSVIGVEEESFLTVRVQELLKLYEEGKVAFEDIKKFVLYDFALDAKRMYGSAAFDVIILYDVDDASKLFSLTTMPGVKVLLISKAMRQALESGDRVFRAAFDYAKSRSMGVYALEEQESDDKITYIKNVDEFVQVVDRACEEGEYL
ncbi:CDP-glycerol glycerophosphotransferase family protein [Eubacterium oxidoreducens]|uniref:CDP-glycerol glycerophosphotransferase, TagB/SpsB family n=1 Tax=Eubacterium oxidoreducens TaxID=1732 RepID=A0A1G6CND1_EUBOX|nr:CDP-glycerol glycerophosphotransferase family protein [Eubacterium oxidoreducens]SDB34401.1 CDP-glycerol glycerophosphotransferase, TagB/SpsB family [Eubacterium oxidoreducens]